MSLSTTHRSHRRTSIPVPRHTTQHLQQHRSSPSPVRASARSTWPRQHSPTDPSTSSGSYTLGWEPEDGYIHGHSRNHEHRRPRARTVAVSPVEIDARARSTRPRSAPLSLSSSALDLCQPCPSLAASRAWLAAGSRKDRRKQSQRRMGPVRRDSGYESDDADEDSTNEEIHYGYTGRCDSPVRMSVPHAQSHLPPSGRPGSGQASLLRPDSPSNESSASTDDDYYNGSPANADPHALEYYLGNDDTWRDAEIYSQSSDESGLSDEEQTIGRRLNKFAAGSSHLPSDMGAYPYIHTTHRRHRRPRMPKRIPLVPTCSKTRKRASMRAAWKMRFGRLFESDSEAGTEVEDELDWEGYESADARRIIALRIHKAGGGDGRKVMEGGTQLTDLLVKKPLDPRRLARRVSRRRVRGDTATTIRPELERPEHPSHPEDACPSCAGAVMSPQTETTSPTSTESVSLPTPSTPPTSVPNTPCPSCAQLSPRGDSVGLPSPLGRRKTLSPRSPPCKTTPLHAGTDPLTVFAVTVEQEKQRDFSGLLKRSTRPPQPTSSVISGLMRGVKSWFGRINNLVDLAASAPLTTAVDGTCPLSPVMGGTRRRAATAPSISTTAPPPCTIPRRRRSLARGLPGSPMSPYGYRVRPQQVEAAFPAGEQHIEQDVNVAATPIPSAAVELQDILPRAEPVEPSTSTPEPEIAPAPADVKGPSENRRRRASRSRSPNRRKKERKEKVAREVDFEANRDELTRSRAVVDSKYWRVLAGEMEQRRRGGVEVAFMVRLAVEEGRNLPIFTSEEQQAATGEIVVGGVWKASLARWRVGGVGRGATRIRSGLVNEVVLPGQSEVSDLVSDSSSSMM